MILWIVCVLVVIVGVALFLGSLARVEDTRTYTFPPNKQQTTYKLIIRNGDVFDGIGSPCQHKHDVAIDQSGVVVAIGPNPLSGKGEREIDATGLMVMLGLVDVHCHYDVEIEKAAGLKESVRHGVTTTVIGNCSLSTTFGTEQDLLGIFSRVENLPVEALKSWIGGKITWKTAKEYYEHVETLPLGINVASFVGHSNVRIAAMGLEKSLKEHKPTEEEMQKMEALVDEAMDAGFAGLSIDMLPWHRWSGAPYTGVSVPSQQALFDEYKRLSHVVRKHDRILQATPSVVDKTSPLKLFSLSSSILFGKPLRTTILAAMDVKPIPFGHYLSTGAAALVNNFFGCFVRFQSLSKPFEVFSDGFCTPLAEELDCGMEGMNTDEQGRKQLFNDKVFRARFKQQWNAFGVRLFHRDLNDMWVVSSPDSSMVGKSFGQLAGDKDSVDFFMDCVATYGDQVRWKTTVAQHRGPQRRRLLANKHCLPGFSDSGAHSRNMAFYDGCLAVIKEALDNPDWLPMEKAIQRITSEPAHYLGIKTGLLGNGERADITIIDPQQLKDELSGAELVMDDELGVERCVNRSNGAVFVVVGGEVIYDQGTFNRELGKRKFGTLLRSTRS